MRQANHQLTDTTGSGRHAAADVGFWPTQSWQTSSAAEQGIDAARLLRMVAHYTRRRARNTKVAIDSITIVRHGHLVADIYLNPYFPVDAMHVIHSCTKSIVSALIGIAIAQGHIESVDIPIVEFLGDRVGQPKERVRALTVEHLLTMQTGLRSQDSYLYQWRGLFETMNTADWTRHVLQLPLDVEPGTRFDYSNLSSYLLSAILTAATGMDTLSFARQYLFAPLGIEAVRWERGPQGIYIGWARMWLKPHDMAKIGLLFLQQGRWENRQVLPAHWVSESTRARSFPKRYRHVLAQNGQVDYRATIGHWLFANLARPFADGYGYQWWLDKGGMYAAIGVGGQYIVVVPQRSLVVVFTSKLRGADSFYPARLLKKFILPAIVSDQAIRPDDAAEARLAAWSSPPEPVVVRKAVPPLPTVARQISGATYRLDANRWLHDNLRLAFGLDDAIADFSYDTQTGGTVRYRVGLDNVYRLSEVNGDTYAARGGWHSTNTFCLDVELVGYSNRDRWTLTFDEEGVQVEESGVTGDESYRGTRLR